MTDKGLPPSKIKSLRLYWAGDPSVGIPSRGQEILGDPLIDLSIFDEEDWTPTLKQFRERLAGAFSVVEDGRPSVIFDFEEIDPDDR